MDPTHVQPNQGDLNVVENSTMAFMHSKRIYLAFQLSTVQPQTELLYAVGPIGQRPNASDGYRLAKHTDQISTVLDYDKGNDNLSIRQAWAVSTRQFSKLLLRLRQHQFLASFFVYLLTS